MYVRAYEQIRSHVAPSLCVPQFTVSGATPTVNSAFISGTYSITVSPFTPASNGVYSVYRIGVVEDVTNRAVRFCFGNLPSPSLFIFR